MQSIAIVVLCVIMSAVYGMIHHISAGHLPLLSSEPATFSGVGRSILASWWVGLLLGVPLALAARAGRRPKRDVRSLVYPILVVLYLAWNTACIAVLAGFVLGDRAVSLLPESLASRVPPDRAAFFLADVVGGATSYLVGFVGAIVVISHVWRSRARSVGPAA